MQGGQPAACSVQILIRQILYYYFLRTTSRSRLRTALRRRNPLSPNVVLHFPSARMRRRSLLVSPILRRSSALFPHTGKCSHPFAHPIWRWAQKCLQRADQYRQRGPNGYCWETTSYRTVTQLRVIVTNIRRDVFLKMAFTIRRPGHGGSIFLPQNMTTAVPKMTPSHVVVQDALKLIKSNIFTSYFMV